MRATLLPLLLAFALSNPSAAQASSRRQWEKIPIPGAVCGDGLPYSIFVSRGDPRKIAVELMGGGACWDFATCIGPTPTTWIHPIPTVIESGGFVSTDPGESPVSDYTVVYLPYCTGDVHLGNHVAHYGPALGKVHHVGRANVERAINYVATRNVVDLAAASKIVLYGYSAGAIGTMGAIFHMATMDRYLHPGQEKTLIVDSPGLHFGNAFWDKFSPAYVHDVDLAMQLYGLHATPGDGNVAAVVPAACARFRDWTVGVLQGSRDLVMSALFGDTTPEEEERQIFGPRGLYTLTENPGDNCSAWVPTTYMHTFLVLDASERITAGGKSAIGYARDLVEGRSGANYRD
jgi:hypothetical protein